MGVMASYVSLVAVKREARHSEISGLTFLNMHINIKGHFILLI